MIRFFSLGKEILTHSKYLINKIFPLRQGILSLDLIPRQLPQEAAASGKCFLISLENVFT